MHTVVKKTVYRTSLATLIASILLSFFFLKKIYERHASIEDLINTAVRQKNITQADEIAVALAQEIHRQTNTILDTHAVDWYARLESFSFFNVTSAVALQYGTYGFRGHAQLGPCGTMSRVLLNALWQLGVPARKLQLYGKIDRYDGHTMVEFYHAGAWRVIAPSDSAFVWLTEAGHIATADEIQNRPEIYAQIYHVWPDYPYTFDAHSNINWEKLPNAMRLAIKAILGQEGFHSAQTPRLYDQPRTVFFLLSVFFAVVSGIIAYRFYQPTMPATPAPPARAA